MPDKYPEIYTEFLASSLIALLLVGFIIVLLLLFSKKKLVQKKEMAALKITFEKELLQTRLEIQEEVLKNISMEIHDNIGQVLLLANVNISILQSLELPPMAPALIVETKELLSKSIDDISQLSRSLHSDRITEMGVFAAITYELKLLAQKGLYEVTVNNSIPEAEKPLPKETQLILFRMYQEIVKNIIKHANATKIQLTIEKKEKGIEMVIKDNGIGFSLETENENGRDTLPTFNGVGMRSLHSRVALLKGGISVHSVLQEGTRISIFIPVTES